MKSRVAVMLLSVCYGLASPGPDPATVIVVEDRNGVPVFEVAEVKMFRYSDYFKTEIPAFEAKVKNVSGELLDSVPLEIIVHKKDGSSKTFVLRTPFLSAGFAGAISKYWLQMDGGPPYGLDDLKDVDVKLVDTWMSPEDRRIAERAEARKSAAEARRRSAEAAATSKRNAEERAKLRAVCVDVYGRTANKKMADLTVKEDQQVRACQAIGMYGSR